MENFQKCIVNSQGINNPQFTMARQINTNALLQQSLQNVTTVSDSSFSQHQPHSGSTLANNGFGNFNFIFPSGLPLQQQIQPHILSNCNFVPISNSDFYAQAAQFGVGLPAMNSMVTFQQLANANVVQTYDDTRKSQIVKSELKEPSKIENTEAPQVDSNNDVEYDNKNRPLVYQCKECPRKFSMNSRLNQHMRCHTGQRPYICSECSFAFTQKSYLVRHAAVHREERPYVCEKCFKTYKHYGSLANHRKTHKNDKINNHEFLDDKLVNSDLLVSDHNNNSHNLNNINSLKNEEDNVENKTNLSFNPTDLSVLFPTIRSHLASLTNTDSVDTVVTNSSFLDQLSNPTFLSNVNCNESENKGKDNANIDSECHSINFVQSLSDLNQKT